VLFSVRRPRYAYGPSLYSAGGFFSGLVAIPAWDIRWLPTHYGVVRKSKPIWNACQLAGLGLAFRPGPVALAVGASDSSAVGPHAAEEKTAARTLCSEFDAYCARTPRLIPGVY